GGAEGGFGGIHGGHGGSVVPILVDNREGPINGHYAFEFETGDGISRHEQGAPNGPNGAVISQGGWSFTFPDGTPAEFSFVADEGGYRVESPLLPTPPPLPHHALLQIEKAERELASGIVNDGSYSGDSNQQQSQGGFQGAQQGFQGAQQGFQRAQQGFQGAQQGFKGAQQGFQGAQQGFQGAQQGFKGAQQGFQGAQQGFQGQGQRFQGAEQGFQGVQQGFQEAEPGFQGVQQRNQGSQQGFQGSRRGLHSQSLKPSQSYDY
ncbi:UNVERIFIED_CONTAM: hypothetical protein GTU68_030310, partial [Idotea baltica]|nr:hypothetical protein [Idotea baltica]